MAVDPKVVGGGAVVVAIGSGGGYGIYKAVSNSSESIFQNRISSLKFELLSKKATDKESVSDWNDWKKLVQKVDSTITTDDKVLEKIKELQKECEGFEENNNHKEFIKKCTKLITFQERVEKLGISILNTSSSDDSSNPDKSIYEERIKHLKNVFSTTIENWKSLATFCETNKSKTHLDSGMDDELWNNYLRACTKDKTEGESVNSYKKELDKSYWDKETVTVETKLKLSGFSVLGTSSEDTKWKNVAEKVIKKEDSSKTTVTDDEKTSKVTSLKAECSVLLMKKYTRENLVDAFEKCTEVSNFNARLVKFGGTTKTEKDDSRWNSKKAVFKSFMDSSKAKQTVSGDGTSENMKSYCDAAKILTFDKFSSSSEIEIEWKNFFDFCATDNATPRDFWTGEVKVNN